MFGAARIRRGSQANEANDSDSRAGVARGAVGNARAATSRRLTGAAALLLLGALACGGEVDSTAQSAITPEQLTARLEAGDPPVILDVRTPEEYQGGHIPGAINIPHTQLAERQDELAAYRDAEVVVLCERGGRARTARAVLEAAEFERLLDLTGHMTAWRAGEFPLE